jgi:hypothetical protein
VAHRPLRSPFPDFFDWRSQTHSLDAIASYAYGTTRKFTPPGNEPSTVEVEYVSADFFRVLDVTPMLGRSFVLDDDWSRRNRCGSGRLVFTDEVALRQCRPGWMTRYRKLSGSELNRSCSNPIYEMGASLWSPIVRSDTAQGAVRQIPGGRSE